jgi:hypothetical protein
MLVGVMLAEVVELAGVGFWRGPHRQAGTIAVPRLFG